MNFSFSLTALALLFVSAPFVAGDNQENPFAPDPNDKTPPVESICKPTDNAKIESGKTSCPKQGLICRFYDPDRDCTCDKVWTCGQFQSTPVVPTPSPTVGPPTCDGTAIDCSGEAVILTKDNEDSNVEAEDLTEDASATATVTASAVLAAGAAVAALL